MTTQVSVTYLEAQQVHESCRMRALVSVTARSDDAVKQLAQLC